MNDSLQSRFGLKRVLAGTAIALALLAGGRSSADEAARETLPEGAVVVGLEAHPSSIALGGRLEYAQLLVTATLEGGDRLDVTRIARLEAPDCVAATPLGQISPRRDGSGTIVATVAGKSIQVPVTVAKHEAPIDVRYTRDVMPVLSRLGCNSGTCHGAQKGKNGFKLSLRGYDVVYDHRALTDDLKGRRFNRANPDKSLFLMKLTGKVPHGGGVLAKPGGRYYDILRTWVADGVELDEGSPRVTSIEIFPGNSVIPLPGMKQQLAVIATFSDGSTRDVTAECFIDSSNTEVAVIDERKIITAVRRGETAALARYEGRYAAAPLFVMGDRSGFDWKDVPAHNRVDELVYEKLRRIKSLPSEVCTDAEFLRRVSIDLTGLPPRPDDVRIFLADTRSGRQKRDELIDRLIGSPEFVEHWTNKWADLLQVNSKFLGRQGAVAFRDWIRGAVASNKPYNEFVFEVLNSSGSTLKNPPASYYKVLRQADLVMENTTQLFLGIRFNCNKCHDHPFERWTENNHWQLASFFAQVGRKDAPGSKKMPRRSATQTQIPAFEEIIYDKKDGELKKPSSDLVLAPVFPYEHAGEIPDGASRRERLARWIVARENPYFARSYVNRLFSYFLGVGLIEPVDDIRAGNPPTNPELLEWLTEQFIESGFDTRHIMRLICRSKTYQHSIETNRWNADDEVNYSHALARRLTAETLFDAVHRATGSTSRFPGTRRGTRAAELLDPSVKVPDGFLDLFGRPPRESACECERSNGMSLGQALTLINGPTVSKAISDPENAIADLMSYEKDNGRVVEELYLSVLCRFPTKEERATMARALDTNLHENVSALAPEHAAELATRMEAWQKKQPVVAWTALDPGLRSAVGGAKLERLEDGSVLVSGSFPEKDAYTIVAMTDAKGLTGFRLEVLPDERLRAKDKKDAKPGPGRPENGNFVLSELRVVAASAADPTQTKVVTLQNATATHSQKDYQVGKAIDGKLETGWAISPKLGTRHAAVFETKEDIGFDGGTILTFRLEQQHPKHSIGRFRLDLTTSSRPVRVRTLPVDVVQALLTPAEKRSDEQKAAIFRQYIRGDADMATKIRLNAAQDIAWVLMNNPAFLFNR